MISIHKSREKDAPLHHKIRVYQADIARWDCERPGNEMYELAGLLMPGQWYLKSVDPEGKRPLAEVHPEIKARASKYY